ncbi:hypothetical protein EVC28_050 [Rhizobium phage RHph_I1_23]|nr:hypothetical protein EVC28_050 [Rhizobium phage RHph_I1_23]
MPQPYQKLGVKAVQTRREMMKSLATGVAVAAVAKPTASQQAKTIELCRHEAGQLADTMKQIAGGQWRVTVDQRLEFILISKVL